MKKTLLILLAIPSWVCSVCSQTVTRLFLAPSFVQAEKSARSSGDASYKLPVALANIGTVSAEDKAVCNYLFPDKDVNGGAWLLAPGNGVVSYFDNSSGNPSSWLWNAPGTAEGSSADRDFEGRYNSEGVFALPSLTVTTVNGTGTYAPDLKIKAGGTSEITTINTREYGETYQFGTFAYGGDGGFVGGTNRVGIDGWGSLFMFNTDDAYMDGINVYLHHKPERYADDARILVQVWLPAMYDDMIVLTAVPLEAEFVKMADIKDASDGVWVPVEGGAVMPVRFDTPLDLYGKTVLFVSVEGFGSDPDKEDFCLLMDVKGAPLEPEDMSNLLAHNSFGRLNGENDYLRPVSYYGGGTGSFAICPVVRTLITSHVSEVGAEEQPSFGAVFRNGVLDVETGVPGEVRVFDMSGRVVCAYDAPQGRSSVRLNAGKGVWIVRGPKGNTLKISR